jgi:hypothetical protein
MWKKLQLFVLISGFFSAGAQNWQFIKPYYELSNEYNAGKIKRLKSGTLIRLFADSYRTILQGYNSKGDSLWSHKLENVYLNECWPAGDSLYFCGWFRKSVQVGNQQFAIGDSLHGIYGIIDKTGTFITVKTLPGANVSIQSICVRHNSVVIGGNFDSELRTDSTIISDSTAGNGFLMLLDRALTENKIKRSTNGPLGIRQTRIANDGTIWVFSDAVYFVKWENKYLVNSDSGYANGQIIFKVNADLEFIWMRNVYTGVGPGFYIHEILLDSLSQGTIFSYWHWGSGASSKLDITCIKPDGSSSWAKSIGTNIWPFVAMDNHGYYYAFAGKAFSLYKLDLLGNIIYTKTDPLWTHQLHYVDFVGEDEFYTVGVCSGNYLGCNSNFRMLGYYSKSGTLGSAEMQFERTISIFPNPTTGKIQLQLRSGTSAQHFIVTDLYGSKLSCEVAHVSNDGISSLDLSYLQKGIYFLHVENESEKFVEKIIIE